MSVVRPAREPGSGSGPFRAVVVGADMARDLRRRVLRPHLAPTDPLPGEDLADTVHFAVLEADGRPLSTCFIFADPYPGPPDADDASPGVEGPPAGAAAWHLRQMATEPGAQGRGAGAAVVRAVLEYVGEQGGALLWCNARVSAVGFYERQGLLIDGGTFIQGDPPVPHRRMWRAVPRPA